MAQWEAFIDQLSPEERAEWGSMTPEERTEMRHELEAEQAEKDRIADEEWRASEAERNRLARQTTHEPILEGLTDKALGRGSSNIGATGEDAPGYPSTVFPKPVSKEVPKKLSLHPTARLLQQRKELQEQGPVAGAGTKATSAISNIRPDLAARNGLQDERVIGKVDEIVDTEGSFDLDGESLSIGEGGTTTAIDAIDKANALKEKRAEDARRFEEEYQEAAFGGEEEGPQNQYEAAMGNNYLHKMPSSKYGGGEDAKKWAEEAAKEESVIKRVPGGRWVWNKKGFKKFIPDNPFTEEKRKQNQELAKQSSSYDTGVHVDEQTGEEFELNPSGLPSGEDLEMSDPSYTSTEGEDLAPFMPPSPKVKPKVEPKVEKKIEEKKATDVKAYDPKTLIPQISKYKAAKTKKEKEEALPTDKDERAAVKEQADKYWIDPRTGFALNLTEMDRRIDRRSEMEMAALFPAADRAAYLYGKKLIDKEDYERMIKPTEKEEAAALLTSVKTQEHLLKVAELKRKASRNPQEKNWIDLYKNAVTNKDYIMQGILGKKLGLKESDLKKSREMSKAQELAKLKGKGKEFKSNFNVEYSTVISNKSDWQKRASAVVMGKENEEFDLNLGTGRPAKYTDRRGYFRSYGLYEQEDALAMGRSELDQILLKAPMARSFMGNPKYAGSDGNFDSSKFVADTTAYERYLMETLIFEGMSTLYQPGVYLKMMQYQAKHTKTGTFAKKLTNK